MPIVKFEDVLGCLALEALGEDRFNAPHIAMPYRRVFGGQLLAQSLAVASAIGAEASPNSAQKTVKSLQAFFLREGDLAEPLEYRVERLREGRSLSALTIRALQSGTPITSASVLLHHAEDEGADQHQLSMPRVAGPEASTPVDLGMLPWEVRSVGAVDLESRHVGPAEYDFWMRAPTLGDDLALHQALLAFATDLTLIGTTLRPLPGLGEADSPERLHTAVTSHSIWFHRPLRLDSWLLVTQTSPVLAGARGFGWGNVFAQSGELVASFAQESMIRRASLASSLASSPASSRAALPGQSDG